MDLRNLIKPHFLSRLKILFLKHEYLSRLFRLRYFSLNGLDQKIESFVDYDKGFYVELGANDGVNQSNTLYFEHFRDWKGILIEPGHKNFTELTRNRSPRNSFRNVACVGPTYEQPTVDLIYSNLMTSTLGIDTDLSDPLDHARKGESLGGGTPYIFQSTAITLNTVLIEADAPSLIDLLSLDVEGVELEVLMGVDHSRFRFNYICVESRQFDRINYFLQEHGYSFVKSLSFHDYLFKDVKQSKNTSSRPLSK